MRKLVYIFILLSFICTKLSASNSIDTNSIKQIFIEAMEYQDYDNDSAWLLAEKGFELSRKTNYKAGIGMAFMRFGSLMNIKGKSDS